MKTRSDSLRGVGYTTISIDVDTKERIKNLAGDSQICDFVRDMVDFWETNHPQSPMQLGTAIQPRDVQEVKGTLAAVKSMAYVWYSLLNDGSAFVPERNKALHDLWNRSMKELGKTKALEGEQGLLLEEGI